MFGLDSIDQESDDSRSGSMSPGATSPKHQYGRSVSTSSTYSVDRLDGPFKDPSYRPKVLKTMPHPNDSYHQLKKIGGGRSTSISSDEGAGLTGVGSPPRVMSPLASRAPYSLARGGSVDTPEIEARILVLYSGGTIGMRTKEDGGEEDLFVL